jgi:hypothetical protein
LLFFEGKNIVISVKLVGAASQNLYLSYITHVFCGFMKVLITACRRG